MTIGVVPIDMSSSRRADRRAYMMELELGGRLVIGGAHLRGVHVASERRSP